MIVIQPVPLTTAMLAASSLPETDYPEWDAGKAYAVGDKIIKAVTHRVYQAVQAGTGKDPVATLGSYWTDLAPTNRWAMFDQVVGTYTVGTGSISVTLAPGVVGALAVLDTSAETVRVQIAAGNTVIYDRTQTTNKSGGVIANWYDYFTAPIGKVMTLSFLDLPLYANAQITVTLTGPGANLPVQVGTLLAGGMIDLGLLEAEPTTSILDFSIKTTDAFGVTTVVPRAFSKQMTVKSLLASSAADGVQRTLAALRATPALWIAEDGFDLLAVYGFRKDFSITLVSETVSNLSLTVEGLI